MLERKSPLSSVRILGTFGKTDEGIGVKVREIKEFSYLEIALWEAEPQALTAKFSELLGLAALPKAGAASKLKGGHLMRIAPRRLAYLGEAETAAVLEATIAPTEGSVIALGHSRCCLNLSGDKVTDLLSRGVRLDLRERAFPVNAVRQTEIHGLGVMLVRRGTVEFDLLFMRSSAGSLWHWLTVSAAQFGYEVE